ncbi:glycosyltransferase family 2 protein [Candidatus Woesearchaeota archaeon]|nr:MAG: glycosyltransferase family 2 protein [Candidatus Woesearchaeota archaeon]
MKQKIFIVIPAYNEEKSVGKVIKCLQKKGYYNIIVVDDGSKDRTFEIASKAGAITLRHIINRGLGGALGTGIKAALMEGADIIVTFDADGQHDVNDIKKGVDIIEKNEADVVIGSRLLNPKGMPLIRRIGNWGFNVITWLLFGVWSTDSQSGLRFFSRKAAEKIRIRMNRMEASSEIIKEIGRNRLRMKEVPIKAIYTDYSMSRGQSSWNAFRILFKLIIRKIMR